MSSMRRRSSSGPSAASGASGGPAAATTTPKKAQPAAPKAPARTPANASSQDSIANLQSSERRRAPARAATQFAAAATPIQKRAPTAAPKQTPKAKFPTCPECQCPMDPKLQQCSNGDCSASPAYENSKSAKKTKTPAKTAARTPSKATTTPAKQPASTAAAAAPVTVASAAKSKSTKRKAATSDDDDEQEADASSKAKVTVPVTPAKKQKVSESASTPAASASSAAPASSAKSRRAKPTNLRDTEEYPDDERDEDYRGATPRKKASAASGAPSSGRGGLLLSGMKARGRDSDLALALAASRLTASAADVAHVASLSESSARDASVSIWAEAPNDPRHLSTLATGIFVVSPTTRTPEGFLDANSAPNATVKETEDMDTTDVIEKTITSPKTKRGAAAVSETTVAVPSSSTPHPPILLRNGFVSASATESLRSTSSRADAFDRVWRYTERQFSSSLARGERRVFAGIISFLATAFADSDAPLDATSAARASRLAVATNVALRPRAPDAGPEAFRGHALPVALVHAGLNVEDHPMLMEGLQRTIRATSTVAAAEAESRRARRRERRREKKEAADSAGAEEAELEPASGEESPSKTKKRKSYTHKSHYYRGLRESHALDAPMDVEDDADSSDDEDDVESEDDGATPESTCYPTPAPFVVTLPETPSTLLSVLRAIYVSFVEAYPSPRSATAHARADHAFISRRLVDKPGPDGGAVYVIERLAQWAREHRHQAQARYDQWRRRRDAKEERRQQQADNSNQTPVPMEVDGEEAYTGEEESKESHGAALPSGVTSTSPPRVYPQHIYPKLVLLVPSLDRFPSGVLQELLELLLDHVALKHFDTRFPFALVWPCAGGDDLVHSILPRDVIERLWFGVFELTPTPLVVSRIVKRCFRDDVVGEADAVEAVSAEQEEESLKSLLATDTDRDGDEDALLLLDLPFHLGAAPMRALLDQFYASHTSVGSFMRVVKYALLELCDAGGHKQLQDRLAPINGCVLSGGFLHAWVRQRRQMSRAIGVSSVQSHKKPRKNAKKRISKFFNDDDEEDAIESWLANLTTSELATMRRLPSLAGQSVPTDDNELRARAAEWIDALHAHRLSTSRAAGVMHRIFASVGLYSTGARAAPAGLEAVGLTPEVEVWLHALSEPLFAPLDSASTATTPLAMSSSCGTGPLARAAGLLSRYERPDALRALLVRETRRVLGGLQRRLTRARLAERRRLDEETAATPAFATTRWLQRAVQEWTTELAALQQEEATTAPVNTPAAAPAPLVSGGAGARRRDLLLQAASASAHGHRSVSTSALRLVHAFASRRLAPLCSLPLAELLCVEDGRRIRHLFQPQPESAIYTALTDSRYYLGEAAANATTAAAANGEAIGASSSSAAAASASPAAAAATPASSSPSPLDLLSPPWSRVGARSVDDTTLFGAVGDSGGLGSSSSEEDAVVAFRIFVAMNGALVNLADWFDAFKKSVTTTRTTDDDHANRNDDDQQTRTAEVKKGAKKTRGRRPAELTRVADAAAADPGAGAGSGAASAASLALAASPDGIQVRFLQCLTTLANLGYLKATQRRVDHVMKLTMHKPY